MSVTAIERLREEIEDLPPDAQEIIVKLVHFLKEEILTQKVRKPAGTDDLRSLIPMLDLGKITTSMRREDMYDNAR